jgi:hypothetical protein
MIRIFPRLEVECELDHIRGMKLLYPFIPEAVAAVSFPKKLAIADPKHERHREL